MARRGNADNEPVQRRRRKVVARKRGNAPKVARQSAASIKTTCCIAGGGPAGMMLGFLLARAGLAVTLLEKQADFLRDFRGDTVHPSTLELMYELGLLDEFLKLPHVLTVDGQVLSRQTMDHTIPFIMSIDESFDIGLDTRTAVDDSYKLPFRFTGTIDKLTYKIGNEQLAADDRKVMQKALAGAHD